LVSGYAHVFVSLSVVIVTLLNVEGNQRMYIFAMYVVGNPFLAVKALYAAVHCNLLIQCRVVECLFFSEIRNIYSDTSRPMRVHSCLFVCRHHLMVSEICSLSLNYTSKKFTNIILLFVIIFSLLNMPKF